MKCADSPAPGTGATGGNGLNQYGRIDPTPTTFTYGLNGNLTQDADPLRVWDYAYDSEGRLISANDTTFRYDAVGRLAEVRTGSAAQRFVYDGVDRIAEYDAASGALLSRVVHGPAVDEPLVVYEGASRTWLYGDERGSIVALADGSGAVTHINVYGVWGVAGSTHAGQFGFTGQAQLGDTGLYHYKARVYSPALGRFLQPDPIGEQGGMNLYAYALNDPINLIDPDGLQANGLWSGHIDIQLDTLHVPPYNTINYAAINANLQHTANLQHGMSAQAYRQQYTLQGIHSATQAVNRSLLLSLASYVLPVREVAGSIDNALAGDVTVGQVADDLASVASGFVFGKFKLLNKLCCFAAGTKISTPTGLRPIKEIKVGDLVMSRDPKTGAVAAKPVTVLIPGHDRRIWEVTLRHAGSDGRTTEETFETTDDHPWGEPDGKWVETKSLAAGQTLVLEAGGTAKVVKIADAGRTAQTYNLEVSDFHTYFVGEGRVLVHNACQWFNSKFVSAELRDQIYTTLEKINSGTRGKAFNNWFGDLPASGAPYSKYYVGPRSGPNRIVVGSDKSRYITFDHYSTFRRIR